MRSALKRDLDANIFPQSVDESDASGESVIRPAAGMRAARPRIVGSDVPEINAPAAAVQPPDSVMRDSATRESETRDTDTPAADALLGDLKRIMASLEAGRASERAAAEPVGEPAVVEAPAAPVDTAPDGKPMGAVAAAALRAFREAERGQRTVPGLGARLLAAEAERIAVERGEGDDAVALEPAPSAIDVADPMFSAPASAGEPYVYGSTLQAPPEADPRDEARVHPDWDDEVPAHEVPADEAHVEPVGFVAVAEDESVTPPPSREPHEVAAPAAGRDWLALPDDEFAPPRYRADSSAPRRVGKGFAFDIHAFVDELEREAAEAGRDWSAREGDALFAKDRVAKDNAANSPVVDRKAPEPLPVVDEPAPLAAEVDLLPPAVEPAYRHREPALPVGLVPHAAGEEPVAGAAVRRARPRRDTFTWKRLALLGVIVTVAGVGAVKLQSIAARNDGGEAVAEAGATDAAVASVAPHQALAPADAVTPAVRNVTQQAVAASEPEASEPVETASADLTPTLRPSDAAETVLRGATAPDRTDRTPDATDQTAASTPAEDAMDAPMEEMGDAGPAAADEAPTTVAATEEAPAVADSVPDQPVAAAPAPQPRPTQVAAVARVPAPSGAAPSGSATIKSGVTLRAGADNKAAALGTLKTGQKVDIVACKLWCEIVADGKRGFVFKKFVEAGAPQ